MPLEKFPDFKWFYLFVYLLLNFLVVLLGSRSMNSSLCQRGGGIPPGTIFFTTMLCCVLQRSIYDIALIVLYCNFHLFYITSTGDFPSQRCHLCLKPWTKLYYLLTLPKKPSSGIAVGTNRACHLLAVSTCPVEPLVKLTLLVPNFASSLRKLISWDLMKA